jgi:hypothetical protein
MPFIGNQPALSYTSFAKQDFTTSATTSYTLDHPVTNENEIALFINFVRQEPTTAYTATGTSLTLTSATSASDDMYCVFLGKAVQTVNPPNGSVGTAQLANSSVTSAKLGTGDMTFSNGNLVFGTASKGVYLGVTSATAANLLNDFEIGTFTPNISPTSGSFTTVGTCTGFYTKIGNIVNIQCELNLTDKGSGSANIDVTNMPFTSAASGLVHTNMLCRETQTNGSVHNVIMSGNVTALVILSPHMANGAGYSVNGWYRV